MGKPSSNKVYEFDEFRLDSSHRMLYRDNEEVSLAPKAVETLLALIERRGEIVPADELMSVIWTDAIVEESNLSRYLHLLRKTLGKRPDGKQFIETLKRRGYRFNGDVAVSETANGSSALTLDNAAEIKDPVAHHDREITSHQREFRVHKRGNVLALADWKEVENAPASESPVEQPVSQPDLPRRSARGLYIGSAILVMIFVTALSFVWFRSTGPKDQRTISEVGILALTNGEAVDYATISPDGNYFTYSSHDGEKAHLWMQQTSQVNRVEIAAIEGAIYGTTFSPDAKSVYFVAKETGHSTNSLYRVPTLGGVKAKVLDDIAGPVSFSPDASEMAFIRGNKETGETSLIVALSDGRLERTLRKHTRDEILYGTGEWSPDGRLIAYGVVDKRETPWAGGCSIVGTEVQSGETQSLTTEKWDNCFRMVWTRDSQGLIFVGTRSKEAFSTRRDQIYYLSLADGQSRRLTTDGSRYQYASLGVTNSNEVLAVPFNRFSQIWSMEVTGDSGSAVQITQGLADGRGGIAPLSDGRVAYLSRNGDGFSIWVMNADGSGRKQLTADPPNIEELRASPVGNFFVFSGNRDGWNHLYRVSANGDDLRQLTFGQSQETDSTVSPDGNWIVYGSRVIHGDVGRSELLKIGADGGEPVRLADIDCLTPHYSPDGRSISCVSPDWRTISIISADDGATFKTFSTIGDPVLNIGSRWTPDGNALAYISYHRGVGNIHLQPVDGGPHHALTDLTSGDIYNFAFSADGSHLYLARGYAVTNAVLISNFR